MPSSVMSLSSDSEDGGCSLQPSSSDKQVEKVIPIAGTGVGGWATVNAQELLTTKTDENAAVPGTLARRESDFCPYGAVSKYPYKYLNYKWAELVSQAFFAYGQLQARGWTIYYVHSPFSNATTKFVPALEFEALLDDIGRKFETTFRFPDPSTEPGFRVNFADCGHYRPKYLGRLNVENPMTELDAITTQESPEDNSAAEKGVDDRSFATFEAKMEAVIEATKNRNKKQRDKKKNQRIEHKAALYDSLKRAQRYLGLADTAIGSFHCDVVFVALDIEVWERNHRIMTEIGITSLDTRDIRLLDPEEDGKAWMAMLRPRHFRITEASHIVNSEFVHGCADRFEKHFGESEWISRREATSVVASCFHPPFSASFPLSRSSNCSVSCKDIDINSASANQGKRNVVLVGHDINSDVEFLRNAGYDLASVPHIIEALDTAKLFKALKQERQTASLRSVLLDLGVTGWNLHNAGNDAAYTMQCLLLIALKASRTSVSDRLASAAASRDRNVELAAVEAKAQILADGDEWNAAAAVHERMGDDGADPVPLMPQETTKAKKAGPKQKQQQEEEAKAERRAKGVNVQVEALSNLDVEAMEKLAQMRVTEGGHESTGKTPGKGQETTDKISARLERRLGHIENVRW